MRLAPEDQAPEDPDRGREDFPNPNSYTSTKPVYIGPAGSGWPDAHKTIGNNWSWFPDRFPHRPGTVGRNLSQSFRNSLISRIPNEIFGLSVAFPSWDYSLG